MNYRVSTYIIVVLCTFAVLLFFSGCTKKETAKNQTEHHEGDEHDHSGHSHADGHDHGDHTHGEGHEHEHQHQLPLIAGVDWCPDHRAPESKCTRCHPEKVEEFKAKNDWCGDHNVPESHCFACNPGIRFPQEEQYRTQAAAGSPL